MNAIPSARLTRRIGLVATVGLLALAPAAVAAPPAGVSLLPSAGSPQVLTLTFYSAALGRSVSNTIYLPNSYSADGSPSPVVYYLHGTVLPELNVQALEPLNRGDLTLQELGPGGGAFQTTLFKFQQDAAQAHFVVVAPDTAPRTICADCLWINGRDGRGMQTETFVLNELLPTVQAALNVRRDRAGRAVMGFSMGGVSAFLYGFRHPDLFAAVGGVSPALEIVRDPGTLAIVEGVGYLRDQSYGDAITDPLGYSRFDPVDIAPNAAGENLPLTFSTGDGCLSLDDLTHPVCKRYPAATNPLLSGVEVILRNDVDHYGVPRFNALGLPFTEYKVAGVHGADNASVYTDHYVGFFNNVFANPRPAPTAFSYLSADETFTIWGYSASLADAGRQGFVQFRDAQLDGRGFSLAGEGSVTVMTPARFTAGHAYTVTITASGQAPEERSVTADPDGRLVLSLTLGSGRGQPLSASDVEAMAATRIAVTG